MPVRKDTVKRVKSFLQDLREGCENRDITNLRSTTSFYGLSNNYSPILRAMEVVVKDPETRTYVWNTGKPGKKLAEEVATLVYEYTVSSTR
jgi:hypothetical protein